MSNSPVTTIKPQIAHIRFMIRRDMPDVLDIERKTFKDLAWEEIEFMRILRHRNCVGMVAEVNERVVGFFIYELHNYHLRLLSLAVDPGFRGQGIGNQCVSKLQSKLSPQRRTHLLVLVPEYCEEALPFLAKHDTNVKVHLTQTKGQMTYMPVFSAMTAKDTMEAQDLMDTILGDHNCKSENILKLITNGSRYGIVVRDNESMAFMGFVLYERDSKGITLNGEFGVMVGSEFRQRGFGRALLQELAKQKLLITFHNVCLTCEVQTAFLKAVGVPVPALNRFVDVAWIPQGAK